MNVPDDKLKERTIDHLDIAFDDLTSPKHYKEEEDPKFFKSIKTSNDLKMNIFCAINFNAFLSPDRGPLVEGWRDDKPIMCSYKLVHASFEVWGLQTRVEDFIQRCIRDVLLLGHRQAFTWIDNWYEMSIEDVRQYERQKQAETNAKFGTSATVGVPTSPTVENAEDVVAIGEDKSDAGDLLPEEFATEAIETR